MPRSFKHNFDWQRELMPQVEHLFKQNAIYLLRMNTREGSFFEDTRQGTDMVLSVQGGNAGVRIRRPDCTYRDFTIRSRNKSSKTELQKLLSGEADLTWYLYGWTDHNASIAEWILIDMPKVIASPLLHTERREIPNGDGTWFISVAIPELIGIKSIINGLVPSHGLYSLPRSPHCPICNGRLERDWLRRQSTSEWFVRDTCKSCKFETVHNVKHLP